jgi:hypothetical protein
MTFTFKLDRLDGTPAEPPTIESTVLSWHLRRHDPSGVEQDLQVVRVRDEDADQPPVLVVADLA